MYNILSAEARGAHKEQQRLKRELSGLFPTSSSEIQDIQTHLSELYGKVEYGSSHIKEGTLTLYGSFRSSSEAKLASVRRASLFPFDSIRQLHQDIPDSAVPIVIDSRAGRSSRTSVTAKKEDGMTYVTLTKSDGRRGEQLRTTSVTYGYNPVEDSLTVEILDADGTKRFIRTTPPVQNERLGQRTGYSASHGLGSQKSDTFTVTFREFQVGDNKPITLVNENSALYWSHATSL